MIQDDLFIPENDINETLADGRLIMLAPAGVPMTLHVARLLGFVKDGAVVPDETKTADGAVVPDETILSVGSGTRKANSIKKL